MGHSHSSLISIRRGRTVMGAAGAVTAAMVLGMSSPSSAARTGTHGGTASRPAAQVTPALPDCAWPVETTPTTSNVAAPDPFATYWTTPFLASRHDSITIRGSYPTSRFMSFAVYNDSFQLFTNIVHGKSVASDLTDYQITANRGSRNPWRSGRVGRHVAFTVRLRPTVTAAQQHSENAIPMIDQNPPASPSGPRGVGYVIFRTYVPAGGNTKVQLPAITVTRGRRSTTLPPCPRGPQSPESNHAASAAVLTARVLTAGSADPPELQYFGPSAASQGGLFPNPVNAYLLMEFTPRQGYVVVTHGRAPTSPTEAGRGVPGDSIGAYPVRWIRPKFQVRYWSIANYLNAPPYPVVENGQGSHEVFGGTADYLTTLRHGYYTVVSSLPADKPSRKSLRANAATWIPTSAAQPTAPEFQLLRNMLSQQRLYPEGFTFIPPPASPSDSIPPATVQQHMGAYYPQTAQCTVLTFEISGWAGCYFFGQTARLAAPPAGGRTPVPFFPPAGGRAPVPFCPPAGGRAPVTF